MVEEIRTQFSLMLDRLDWMDEVTRANAKEKAEAMETHIGYPIELLDMKTLDQLYSGLDLQNNDFFGEGVVPEAMETHIGYPIELLDMKTLDQQLNGITYV